jgi:hypothetical protein
MFGNGTASSTAILHSEGARLAPAVGKVMTRWGVLDDPEMAYAVLDGWVAAHPSGIEGRRQMPHFPIPEEEMRGLAVAILMDRSWSTESVVAPAALSTRCAQRSQPLPVALMRRATGWRYGGFPRCGATVCS